MRSFCLHSAKAHMLSFVLLVAAMHFAVVVAIQDCVLRNFNVLLMLLVIGVLMHCHCLAM